jgi:hypothetical protein
MGGTCVRLGGFELCPKGRSFMITTPAGRREAAAEPFLRGTNHLLIMRLDLEGEAELEGGLVFRAAGDRVVLSLSGYSETFSKAAVERCFRDLAVRSTLPAER